MSKLQIQIGSSEHIQISLPTKMIGDANTFIGKAKVHVSSLACSQHVQISKADLSLFFTGVERAYKTLKGEFTLASASTLPSGSDGFVVTGRMTRRGHVKVTVVVRGRRFQQPDDTEWKAEASFSFEPDRLNRILDVRHLT